MAITIQFMYVQYMIRPNSSSLIQNGDPVIKQSTDLRVGKQQAEQIH